MVRPDWWPKILKRKYNSELYWLDLRWYWSVIAGTGYFEPQPIANNCGPAEPEKNSSQVWSTHIKLVQTYNLQFDYMILNKSTACSSI